jgi:hypothetical protein
MAGIIDKESAQALAYTSSYTLMNDKLGGPVMQDNPKVFSEEFADTSKIIEICQKAMAFANDHNDELLGIQGLDRNSRITSMEAIANDSNDMLATIQTVDGKGELSGEERYSTVPVTDIISLAKDYDRGPAPNKAEERAAERAKNMSAGPEASSDVSLGIE